MNNAALFVQVAEAVAWVVVGIATLSALVLACCAVVGFITSGDDDL
jgi:hypothetical protein